MQKMLPLGKLPPELLAQILAGAPVTDERVVVRPGPGLDCAVIDIGDRYLVLKSDPITFATDDIGWYLVQVNSNDIATTGGTPLWLMATIMLPEAETDVELVNQITDQLYEACRAQNISVIGGHTEITHGLNRPILSATLIGEVAKDKLITPQGAAPGDAILLTKGIPIEAAAILAREFPDKLMEHLSGSELKAAQDYLFDPGISVLLDAKIATQNGRVTAMHDPTEGGLAGALWELAEACGHTLTVDSSQIHTPELADRICQIFGLDPLATIASGALLLTVKADDAPVIMAALAAANIQVAQIGEVTAGKGEVRTATGALLDRPARDELARLYESM